MCPFIGRASGRIRRCTAVVAAAVVSIAAFVAAAPPASAAPDFPDFTGVEFKNFYYASMPLPQTRPITARPSIYGNASADLHIQQLAERRGYRLQAEATGSLANYGGMVLSSEAGRAWLGLADAARRNGTPLQGVSGHRDVARQRSILQSSLASEGRARIGRPFTMTEIANGQADAAIDSVLTTRSIPGYSRHHTGVTIDVTYPGGTLLSFAGSAAHRWISADNYAVAKAHGFIPNYPPGAGAQGPAPEPWEFSYIGVDAIRCASEVVTLADPRAPQICGKNPAAIVGNFDGDGIEDVFVYRPGSAREGLFPGTSSRRQTTRTASPVTGVYTPLTGDFDGNGIDDILWYAPGGATDYLWYHAADGGHSTRVTEINGNYAPVVGDFDGNGVDDIFWYAGGPAADYIWFQRPGGGHRDAPSSVNGLYRPVAGDFDADGDDDILWYAPGTVSDFVWYQAADGSHRTGPTEVNGRHYRPVSGDFDDDGRDDIVWYAPGGIADFVWYHRSGGAHSTRSVVINGTYSVGAGDHDGNGIDDVVHLPLTGSRGYVWFSEPGFRSYPRSY